MFLKTLYLHQFRNYREAYFDFGQSLNLICGTNAQGKTTVLEAIHTLMSGYSFRPGLQQDLIHSGCNACYFETLFTKHGVDQKLQYYLSEKERKITHNHTPLSGISGLPGLIQGVIMTPDDALLVKGSPLLRRQFLDEQISQIDPLYVHFLSRYSKAMRHRNQLLKQKRLPSIESWEHEMARASAYIVLKRLSIIKILQMHANAFYNYLTKEREDLSLRYCSSASGYQTEEEIKIFYLSQFEKNRPREVMIGHTLTGPHKDDIWIGIGGRDARFFASEGQQRSCVIALRMGEWKCLEQISNEIPLLMIDDVGMGLDAQRRERLIQRIASLGQVFLTTTDADLLNTHQGEKKMILLPLYCNNL